MKNLICIPTSFAEVIYAPNDMGWDRFREDIQYWKDIPSLNLADYNDNQLEKLEKYISNTIDELLNAVLAFNKNKLSQNIPDYSSLLTLKKYVIDYCIQLIFSDVDLAAEELKKNIFNEALTNNEDTLSEADKYKLNKLYDNLNIATIPEIVRHFLETHIKLYQLSKSAFISEQKENFKKFIEPAAWEMVCYLLSHKNMTTYESQTNTQYNEEGKRTTDNSDNLYKMDNGVWFRVIPDNHEDRPHAATEQRRYTNEKYYFAKLHNKQFTYNCLTHEHTEIRNDIYTVSDAPNVLFPSKQFNENSPVDSKTLKLYYLNETQIDLVNFMEPKSNDENALDEAINRATLLTRRELQLEKLIAGQKTNCLPLLSLKFNSSQQTSCETQSKNDVINYVSPEARHQRFL